MSLIDHSEIIALLKAVANEQRFLIITELMRGEKNVGELVACFSLSQSALSQHLAKLRRDNIVKTRRQSQLIYYFIENENVSSFIKYLEGFGK